MNEITSYWWIILILFSIIFYKFILRVFFGMVMVPEDKIGLVTKKFVLFGADRSLPDGRIIATKGEAGYQAQTLAPGLNGGTRFCNNQTIRTDLKLIRKEKLNWF